MNQPAPQQKKKRLILLLLLLLIGLGIGYFQINTPSAGTVQENQKTVGLLPCVDVEGEKYGFKNESGELIISYEYDQAAPFDAYGFARVEAEGQLYLIDATNRRYPFAERVEDITTQTLALSLNDQALTELPQLVLEHPQVQILYCRGNLLTTLPEEINALQNLRVLDLAQNQFRQVPYALEALSALEVLDLQQNFLEHWSSSLWGMAQLQELNLSHNQLSTIPDAIGHLQALSKLNVSNNQLESVSTELAKIETLEEVDLSNNNLEEVPEALVQRTQLLLNMGGNRMKYQSRNHAYKNDLEEESTSKFSENEDFALTSSNDLEGPTVKSTKTVTVKLKNSKETEGTTSNQTKKAKKKDKALDCSGIFTKDVSFSGMRALESAYVLLFSNLDFKLGCSFAGDKDHVTWHLTNIAALSSMQQPMRKNDKVMLVTSGGEKKIFTFQRTPKNPNNSPQTITNLIGLSKSDLRWMGANKIAQIRLLNMVTAKMYPYRIPAKHQDKIQQIAACFLQELE